MLIMASDASSRQKATHIHAQMRLLVKDSVGVSKVTNCMEPKAASRTVSTTRINVYHSYDIVHIRFETQNRILIINSTVADYSVVDVRLACLLFDCPLPYTKGTN